MNRPPRYRRKSWRKTQPPVQARLTRRESFQLAAIGIALFIGAVLLFDFFCRVHVRRDRDAFLERLRTQYSLTDTQLAAIRKIEEEYHGTGSILFRPSRSSEEAKAHPIEISKEMSSEAAARFLTYDRKATTKSLLQRR